jgi:hypothetical protein
MPRTLQEILDHADELADRFEKTGNEDDVPTLLHGGSLRDLRRAVLARAEIERRISDAVSVARAEGHSWAMIGVMLGTTGEAARQRYGTTPAQPG